MKERLISIKEVKHMTSLSPSTIYRKVGKKIFPAPIRIEKRTVWTESSIQAWIRAVAEGCQWQENGTKDLRPDHHNETYCE
ncbi:helix-turn-helix transcriptional regulator [Laribacter hongkongensis]|uniref:helix-turn-helix transcriptional regulator n=1 Tax=Laribacter hongkongensis TaxID=168471 RepID=UPI0009D6A3FA|nr:AlpA family phage regulatory protein [Laribacter hongkongensis]MCG8994234.1 AlpA family phage regulatory protein [Laribacter hongkongensis]MCG9009031.1 AlpA family phage regulatory protein [Laribacter hongkongensis]MCG9021478.1 AlpA family phage regulatory protein [Laribacter hongkongensis]MCG9046492.1 AlpA family phage regulatory protein [Laribacter hongkongensis]MCG9052382.1 AlpA family phage regulatory protein [Laribacter hongkongensis]